MEDVVSFLLTPAGHRILHSAFKLKPKESVMAGHVQLAVLRSIFFMSSECVMGLRGLNKIILEQEHAFCNSISPETIQTITGKHNGKCTGTVENGCTLTVDHLNLAGNPAR